MQAEALSAESLVKAARDLLIPGAEQEDIERIVEGLKRAQLGGIAGLKPLKVKVLGNITTDYITDHIRFMLVRNGFAAKVEPGHYGGLVRGLMGEADLTVAGCDAAVLILTHRDVQFPPQLGMTAQQAREPVQRGVDFWVPLLQASRVRPG